MRYSDSLQGFPEDALRTAVAGRAVLEVREHFFVHDNVPHLTLVLLLGDAGAERSRVDRAPDPGKDLPANLRGLYRELRHWRNERAKQDGVPSYVIMRNALVAEICRRLPRTLAELREIEGVGEATCARYGEAVLGLIPEDLLGDDTSGDPSAAGEGDEGGPEGRQQ